MTEPAAPSVAEQIAFARFNFDNHQSLIRFADAKVGAILTLVFFLGASALPIAKDAIQHAHWHGRALLLTAPFAAGGLVLVLAFIRVLVTVEQVIKPRGARHTKGSNAANLIWQDHVLAHIGSWLILTHAGPRECLCPKLGHALRIQPDPLRR